MCRVAGGKGLRSQNREVRGTPTGHAYPHQAKAGPAGTQTCIKVACLRHVLCCEAEGLERRRHACQDPCRIRQLGNAQQGVQVGERRQVERFCNEQEHDKEKGVELYLRCSGGRALGGQQPRPATVPAVCPPAHP